MGTVTEDKNNYEELLQQIAEQVNRLTIISERKVAAFEGMSVENNFTLLNNSVIINKFTKEISEQTFCAEDFADVFYDLEQLCQLARNQGYFTLVDYVPKKPNHFLTNMVRIYSAEWPGNDKQAPFLMASYWLTPYLLSGAAKGKEFIEDILYYEGIMMITAGGSEFKFIKFRLLSLLGEKVVIE